MKKLFLVAVATFVLASCGDGSSNVESTKDSLVNAVDQKSGYAATAGKQSRG